MNYFTVILEGNDMEYIIENGEVIITNIGDDNSVLIDIPEFIEGYPVTTIKRELRSSFDRLRYINIPMSVNKIDTPVFIYASKLTHINDTINDGFIIINNKFIYCYLLVYVIKYQIGDDYVSEDSYGDVRYFIDEYRYIENFIG